MAKDPFDTYDKNFNYGVGQSGLDPFKARVTRSKQDQEKVEADSNINPVPVALPRHLYIPVTGKSVDLRRAASVPPLTSTDLIVFTAPQGFITKFIGYAIYNDALIAASVSFVPTVNNKRIFNYHGDPQDNYRISLGLTPDLGNEALIACQLDMNPGDVLRWSFTNSGFAAVNAGVRMSGYIDSVTQRKQGYFGG